MSEAVSLSATFRQRAPDTGDVAVYSLPSVTTVLHQRPGPCAVATNADTQLTLHTWALCQPLLHMAIPPRAHAVLDAMLHASSCCTFISVDAGGVQWPVRARPTPAVVTTPTPPRRYVRQSSQP